MTQSRFNAFLLSLAGARHRGAATLAALSLALVAASCGSGGGGSGGSELSKAQYEQHLQADSQAITKAFTPLRKPPQTLAQLAGQLKVGEGKLREAATDLDGVKPPKNAQADNVALVKGFREFADELELYRKAAVKKDPKLVQQAVARLQKSHALVDARKATDDLKKKGYKLASGAVVP
jgi:hypothetical protein